MSVYVQAVSATVDEEIPAHFRAENQARTPATDALLAACAAGDAAATEAALARGGYANWFAEAAGGETPVHAAAKAAGGGALDALAANAASRSDDLRPRFDLKSTVLKAAPLHCAAEAGRAGQVEALLALGVDVDARNCYGSTPLHLACAADERETAAALMEAGADPAAVNNAGLTVLHMAVAGVGKALRVNGKENDGEACLAIPRMLLESKAAGRRADPNAPDANGQTCLHHAAAGAEEGFTAFFVLVAFSDVRQWSSDEFGSEIRPKVRVDGISSTQAAAMRERPATVALAKLLLAKGGRAKVQDNEGKRPADLGASRATPRGEMTALLRRHEMLVLG